MSQISNPVLRGFNPDPSILRVGDDYYLATSTFEWFPGVRIHHSRDLVHWRVVSHPLDRPELLDLRGDVNSGGVWAPCLTFSDGLFWLVYTDVKRWGGPVFETNNYLVTAPSVTGPWSEPAFLNRSGFDPSLYHAPDGRKWLLNMRMGFGRSRERGLFDGIVLQELDPRSRTLIGRPRHIFAGTHLRTTEGPHLYFKDGHHYLFVAEGGTGVRHAVSVARSRAIEGPYEADPATPLLTSHGDPSLPLHKAGHASLVQAADGSWWIAHLCSRPLPPSYNCPLGRETALQRVVWTEEGWPRLAHGGNRPASILAAPQLPPCPWPSPPPEDDFSGPSLGPEWQTLRIPPTPDWCSLTARPGHLRLRGQESWQSLHRQSVVARRLTEFDAVAEVTLEFHPTSFQHLAGLAAWYNTENHVYLHVTHDESAGRCLKILRTRAKAYEDVLCAPLPLPERGPVRLRLEVARSALRFHASWGGQAPVQVGPDFPLWELADEFGGLFFTGTFIALCAHDLEGQAPPADFSCFTYHARHDD